MRGRLEPGRIRQDKLDFTKHRNFQNQRYLLTATQVDAFLANFGIFSVGQYFQVMVKAASLDNFAESGCENLSHE